METVQILKNGQFASLAQIDLNGGHQIVFIVIIVHVVSSVLLRADQVTKSIEFGDK